MDQFSRGLRVQIYCGEAEQVGHKPRYQAILEFLRKEGAAGATVTRGIAGFGRGSLIHTAAILRLSLDLPVVITWVDAPERVNRLLPKVRELAGSGVITLDEVSVASYGHRAIGQMRFDLQVRDVMTTDVRTVRSDARVRDAAAALVGQHFRALPVVDERGKLVGVVSNTDLVDRGGLGVRVELLNVMEATERERFLSRAAVLAVASVMTADPVTIKPTATLADATKLMSERRIKRLPVVESDGRLVGILSRADILRAVAESFPRSEAFVAQAPGPRVAAHLMRTEVPKVQADATLDRVVDVVCSTRLNRAVVVDRENRVVGVISDAVVLRALGSASSTNVVGALMRGAHLASPPTVVAHELMATPSYAVQPNTPLSAIARIMTEHRRKVVPVVDAEGRLLGVIDRADLLHATHGALRELTTIATLDEEE